MANKYHNKQVTNRPARPPSAAERERNSKPAGHHPGPPDNAILRDAKVRMYLGAARSKPPVSPKSPEFERLRRMHSSQPGDIKLPDK
jgi:hypothetical protein